MRMVRLSRDASKQDEARELLAPVYRSVEPRPFFPHSSTMPGPELPMRKPTTSFARSTDGDRLLTAIIDPQICLMLHDGEKCKLDLAVGLSQNGRSRCVRLQPSQCQIAAGEGRRQGHHPRLWHGHAGVCSIGTRNAAGLRSAGDGVVASQLRSVRLMHRRSNNDSRRI